MDPVVTTIISVLAGAALAAGKDLATDAVKAAFTACKRYLVEKLKAGTAISAVEEDPLSKAAKQLLEEKLVKGNAANDAELGRLILKLQDALSALPSETAQTIGTSQQEIKAGRDITIRNLNSIQSRGGNVFVGDNYGNVNQTNISERAALPEDRLSEFSKTAESSAAIRDLPNKPLPLLSGFVALLSGSFLALMIYSFTQPDGPDGPRDISPIFFLICLSVFLPAFCTIIFYLLYGVVAFPVGVLSTSQVEGRSWFNLPAVYYKVDLREAALSLSLTTTREVYMSLASGDVGVAYIHGDVLIGFKKANRHLRLESDDKPKKFHSAVQVS
jgi:hypothetical protein